jgi:hypothetical protein
MKPICFSLALGLTALTVAPAYAASPASVYTTIINCAPHIDRGIVVGILSRESSISPWQPLRADEPNLWKINDNTARRSYSFPNYISAVNATERLVNNQHHVVAIGMGQILSDNLPQLHVTIADAFLPCTNLSLAQKVLLWGYVLATDTLHVPAGLTATHVALQLYYAGEKNYRDRDALDYANDVMNRAAAFNARANAPAPTTIANLPMPDRPWPTGANLIPYVAPSHPIAPTDRRSQPPNTADAYRAWLQARAAADQRRLNSYFQDGNR